MSWCHLKGLITRDPYVKYERASSDQSKVMTKVKVFVDKRTDRRTDRQTDGRTDGQVKNNIPPESLILGHKKIYTFI